jgi:iron complex outermembrane receptor protein
MMLNARNKMSAAVVSLLAGISPNSALAQPAVLEEVIVTAQKRASSLQDVPISVVALGGERMDEVGIKDLGDLSAYVPNFQKADTPIGQYLSIRGISTGMNAGFEQSVVQYLDDIALGRSSLTRLPFLDIERIEVLRGPQNVLFGKNSIGGALSRTSAKPTDQFFGRVFQEYEPEYDGQEGQFIVSGPIVDGLRGRLAARYYEEDGFFENNLNGADEAGREEAALRGILAWDVTDTLETSLKLERSTFDLDGRGDEMLFTYTNPIVGDPTFGMTYPEIAQLASLVSGLDIGSDDGTQNFRRNTNIDERSELEVDIATLRLQWAPEWGTVTSITGWVDYKESGLSDTDGSGIDAFTLSAKQDYRQFSQEIRLLSPGGQTVDWIAGAFYQTWELDNHTVLHVDDGSLWSAAAIALGQTALQTLTDSDTPRWYSGESDSWAVFGQATWNVSDSLRLTLGGRYTEESKDATRVMDIFDRTTGEFNLVQAITASAVFGVDFKTLGEETNGAFPIHDLKGDRDEEFFTPAFIAEYDIADDSMVYFNASKGFKAGGFDSEGNKAGNFEYRDESVLSFELGVKSRLLDGAAEINAALFYIDYDNLQVSQFDGTLGFVVGNAPEATSQGVEIDGRLQLTENIMLSGSVGYLDFEFDNYQDGACAPIHTVTTGELLCNYSGKGNIFTPDWSASVSADYLLPLGNSFDLRAGADLNYKDEHFVDVTLNPDVAQDAYTMINARLALEAEAWSVALVGRNLTDEEVRSWVNDTPLASTFSAPAYTGYMMRPRTVALQLILNF